MKKVFSLMLSVVMLFTFVFASEASAFAAVSMDNTIVAKNTQKIYDYINEYGVENSDGDTIIGETFTDDGTEFFACMLVNSDGALEFYVELYDEETDDFLNQVCLEISGRTAYLFFNLDDDEEWEFAAHTALAMSYTHNVDLSSFVIDAVSNDVPDITYQQAYDMCNALLSFSFFWWNDLLTEAMDLNMSAVGFYNYCTHSLKTTTTQADLSKNGKVVKKCPYCGYTNSTTVYSPKTITIANSSLTYNGKVRTPAVTVKDSGGKTLIKGTDYTVSYASGRKNVGKYSVKVTFKGKYKGSKTVYFTINPAKTSISSLTAGSKSFTVKWKKQATQTTGYQIQYSANSNFKSAKTVTVASPKTVSKKVTGLTKGKKYYVRVRTYKTVGKTKFYSGWSGSKSVITK